MDLGTLENACRSNVTTRRVFRGVKTVDALSTALSTGCYIVNLSGTGEAGTHWVTIVVTTRSVAYQCPEGGRPSSRTMTCLKAGRLLEGRKLYHSTRRYQRSGTSTCGIYCLLMVLAHADRTYSLHALFNAPLGEARDRLASRHAQQHYTLRTKHILRPD